MYDIHIDELPATITIYDNVDREEPLPPPPPQKVVDAAYRLKQSLMGANSYFFYSMEDDIQTLVDYIGDCNDDYY